MANIKKINISQPDDHNGDLLRTAFDKVNKNNEALNDAKVEKTDFEKAVKETNEKINGKQPTGDYATNTDLNNGLNDKLDARSGLRIVRLQTENLNNLGRAPMLCYQVDPAAYKPTMEMGYPYDDAAGQIYHYGAVSVYDGWQKFEDLTGEYWTRHITGNNWTSWENPFSRYISKTMLVGFLFLYAEDVIPDGFIPFEGIAIPDDCHILKQKFGANMPDFRGNFPRMLGGNSAGILQAQGDAIRNIVGDLKLHGGTYEGTGATSIHMANGVFLQITKQDKYIEAMSLTSGSSFSYDRVRLDVSTQLPTANENRPQNIALRAMTLKG